jgi:MurNAc alpha-1-phosphate uridylyltransferase
MTRTMILAAGRGERMRPLSERCPKPLLPVAGKPLVEWQIERLTAAGFRDLVINVSHHADQIEAALGDGTRFGASIAYAREPHPLEVAGGIATALPLLGEGVTLVVSGDIHSAFDYASLRARLRAMEQSADPPHAHMVMVPNPAYHTAGDFVLADGMLSLGGGARLTFANIALYRTSLFRELPRGQPLKMLPLYREWIAQRWVSGEVYRGAWANVGTPADLAELDAALRAAQPAAASSL